MLKIPILGKVIMWCDKHKMYGAIVVFAVVFIACSCGYALNEMDTKITSVQTETQSTNEQILIKLDNLQVQSENQYKEIRQDIRTLMLR